MDPFPIDLDRTLVEETVSRKFKSNVYGGNPQKAFPIISEKKLQEHGLNDFMYLTLDHHPHAPQVPGAPGLYFSCGWTDYEVYEPTIRRYFIRLCEQPKALWQYQWQYQGQYTFVESTPLTTEEWASQNPEVRLPCPDELLCSKLT